MAACGSLQHIFEKPLPENPTLLESLSSPWNQVLKTTTNQQTSLENQSSSFTEIFGELHFKESSLYPTTDIGHEDKAKAYKNNTNTNNSTNNSLTKNCTEGLGFESSDDITTTNTWLIGSQDQDDDHDDRGKESNKINKNSMNTISGSCGESVRRSKTGGRGFPPPISCLRKNGKHQFCLKSYREEGRFVLKEIRVKSEEFLHACREDGRLKLHFVHPNYDDGIAKEDCEDDDDDGDDDDHDDYDTFHI